MREQLLAVQRMQDYINKHLCEKITLADLAKASYFHHGTQDEYSLNLQA